MNPWALAGERSSFNLRAFSERGQHWVEGYAGRG